MTKETRTWNGEKIVSLISNPRETGQLYVKKKMRLDHFLIPHTKLNSKWIKDLNVTLDIIKFLEENNSRILFDINHSNIFLNLSPKVRQIKAKTNKWGLINHKGFVLQRKPSMKTKRQPTELEKISVNYMNHKGSISNIYKVFI